MSSGNKTTMASPLSWTAFAGLKDMKNPAFQPRLDALLLQDPNSEVSKIAIAGFLKALKAEIAKISAMAAKGENMSAAPLGLPAFPDAAPNKTIKPDTIPTFTYNWCVSPLRLLGIGLAGKVILGSGKTQTAALGPARAGSDTFRTTMKSRSVSLFPDKPLTRIYKTLHFLQSFVGSRHATATATGRNAARARGSGALYFYGFRFGGGGVGLQPDGGTAFACGENGTAPAGLQGHLSLSGGGYLT
jgi:hypothetical protein